MTLKLIKLGIILIIMLFPQILNNLDSNSSISNYSINDNPLISLSEEKKNYIVENSNDLQSVESDTLEVDQYLIVKMDSKDSEPPIPEVGSTIAVIVDFDLYNNSVVIQSKISQYVADLTLSGYIVILYTEILNNATALKILLQDWYYSLNLEGAVLIGPLPYVEFYHPANPNFSEDTFVCDLFFTDMDGHWYDLDDNGVYDKHNDSISADIYPEIYIGRIDASTRTLGSLTNEENIINILDRVSNYRRGGIARSNRALSFIDDDWELWANGTYDNWPGWMNEGYENVTAIYDSAETTASKWISELSNDYEFAHLCAHSSYMHHAIYNPSVGGYENVLASEINDIPPSFNFYNLFCCHGAQWTETDCLASTYLFAGSYSLAVVGSTKTGGMLDGNNFYDPLGDNSNIGEALYEWFQGITTYSYTEYVEWFYGMCILGDPFSTIEYDCSVPQISEISSPTHPNPEEYYVDQYPTFNWTEGIDLNNITGYYYLLDQNPTTSFIKTDSNVFFTNNTWMIVDSPLSSGTWYLHVVAEDSLGNLGDVEQHFQVNIDNEPPIIDIISPIDDYFCSSASINANWSIVDNHSGFLAVEIRIDDIENLVYVGNGTEITITDLSEGEHLFIITAFDNLGLSSTKNIVFYVDLSDPICKITGPVEYGALCWINKTNILVKWTFTDSISSYTYAEIRVNGELFNTTYSPDMSCPIDNLREGSNKVEVTVYSSSNRYDSEFITIHVDLKDPIVNITEPINGNTYSSGLVTISFTAYDEDSGLNVTHIYLDDVFVEVLLYEPYSYSTSITEIGYHEITIITFDCSGRNTINTIVINIVDKEDKTENIENFTSFELNIIEILGLGLIISYYKRNKKKRDL